MKKFIAILLIMTTLISIGPSPAFAEEGLVNSWAIVNKISNASESMNHNLTGDYGLLFNLKHLMRQAMWTEYAIRSSAKSDALNKTLSTSEINVLKERYLENVKTFNETYNNIKSDYITVGRDLLPESPGTYGGLAYRHLNADIAEIVEMYLSNLLAEYDAEDDEGKKLFLEGRKSLLSEINTVVEYGVNAKDFISGSVGYKWESVASNPNYIPLLEYAKAVDINSLSSYDTVEFKQANSYISSLSTAYISDKGIEADSDTGKISLESQYLAMVAASAVYVPFVSHTGDADYLLALKNIVNNDTQYEFIANLYTQIKNTKKPLYFVQKYSKNGKWSKDAVRVTIEDFIKICNSDSAKYEGNFVMQKGILDRVNNDTDSWAYFNPDYSGKSNSTTTTTTTTTEQETGSTDPTVTDPNQTTETVTETTTTTESEEDAGTEDQSGPNYFFSGSELASINTPVQHNLQLSSRTSTDANTNTEPPTDPDIEDALNEAEQATGGNSTGSTPTTDESQSSEGITRSTDNGGYVKVDKIKTSYTMDGDSIPVTTQCTEPVFAIDSIEHKGRLCHLVAANIMQSTKTLEKLKNPSMRLVYMNAFGDIVLEDNTIIIPGSANPYMYDEKWGFSPYSVAVMNNMPTIEDGGKRILLNNKDSKNKYIFAIGGKLEEESRDSLPQCGYYIYQLVDKNAILHLFVDDADSKGKIMPLFIHCMPVQVGGETASFTMFKEKPVSDGLLTGFKESIVGAIKGTPLVKEDYSINGDPIFPYTQESEAANNFISRNMYWAFTTSSSDSSEGDVGRLDATYVVTNIMSEALFGTDYNTYATDMQNTYDWYSNTMAGRFANLITSMLKPVVVTLGDVDGVLGVKNSYEDGILSRVIGVFESYMIFILVGLTFMLVLIFMRRRATFIHTLILACFVIIVIVGMVRVVPVYIPVLYNAAVQNIVSELSYGVLTSKMEMYFTSNYLTGNLVQNGKVESNTGSIMLYKFNNKQMKDFCEKENIQRADLLSGDTYMLDDANGIYVQGDVMKVALDSLFSNPIVGNYEGSEMKKYYSFEYRKMYSSNVDYYMPYNLILDNFITRINEFTRIYNVPRNVVNYGDGFFKDSFAIYSYVNSALFLTPGDYDYILETADAETAQELMTVFGENKDFLGISDLFKDTEDSLYRETLWWKTLEDNGFIKYVPGTMQLSEESIERLNNLVEYTNYQTKKFIIHDLNDQLGSMSDDNMLKVIALYATCCFNNKAANYGNWLYPNNINFPELTLQDVMVGTFTDKYDKFIAMNYNILDYMYSKYDLFHTTLYVFDMLLCFLIAYVFKFTIPVLYIVFCILIILNFIRGDDSKELVKGYSKILLRTVLLMIGYSCSFVLAKALNDSAFSIWILMICDIFVLKFLFDTVMRVLYNPTAMGNNYISGGNLVTNLINKGKRLHNVNTNILQYNRSQQIYEPEIKKVDRFVEYRINGKRKNSNQPNQIENRNSYYEEYKRDYSELKRD